MRGSGATDDEDESLLEEEVADRAGLRGFFGRHHALDLTYRIAVGVVGCAIVLTGVALIPLPGPGWLIVFAGLALLATEFVWADRLLRFARGKVQGWTNWVLGQSLVVRVLIGLVSLLAVAAAVVALYVRLQGVPGWLPLIG